MPYLTKHLLWPLAFLVFYSCAYKSKEVNPDPCAVFQNVACDTTTKYTYDGHIFDLMENNGCNGCHDSNNGDSPKLDTKADLIAFVTDCNKRAKFEAAVKYTGSRPMPKGGPKMDDADIQKVLAWICQGAKP